ncbi:MAG: hypothetical protein A3D24_04505 [Candidatus Blackburnbacteria bacterium RIFCSPHIGHO2_02_FULL_39_13]|uniref:UDP-N-acetylmuramyl-tripeptide synthetase n=1 Tax=Candidatus Magasanikbacteria bacterium GW2011_GWA2_42_32 TaxID=1619039 RepID=A0A0G1A609_9BACT|nr:MAG: UDP-N-acetylmuramoyl-L-alanyl-D-glutamate-2,6-diaminopimelate ligase [Candidatus Magasanikbacteria bacterium GW2011_GWA2_42_32]OGY07061.1 MAG: hypothetical protein A2694_01475 [Candidatus Blackburnbacteria bacterium RIFCSPHIGHO2_01_FULL_40_17]OGY08577.1 MAG: hypothetical protein A3D24_04505 [Candidatus Blackburnbacteria bacterium RIFCSPHIGHO2_02_FULL_39_13]HBL52412.1 UDP-N-acetylmuramoyl-L-alanyl-D-glutamate--2,6-diaminopimelate ligase [Candidatus Blackburnbacteria bacterium]
MKLTKLLDSYSHIISTCANSDIEISRIQDDSRKVQKGDLFIAIKGLTFDAHDFIPQTIKDGAVAIVGEKDPKDLNLGNIPYVQVENSRRALSFFASIWFNNPSEKLKAIGITGTEGKTTTSNILYHILTTSNKKTGLVSTINAKIDGQSFDTGLHVTNPEPLQLQELLSKMVDNKCEYAILETTSIGIDQERVTGVKYLMGVLTNITQDHLDYHKTIENYKESKAKLFERVKIAVLNKDDSSFEFIKSHLIPNCKLITYGITNQADCAAQQIKMNVEGTKFILKAQNESKEIATSLLGEYNVYNILAAIAASCELGVSLDDIKKAIATFQTPEGRLEKVEGGQDFTCFVDFAHTAKSVESVLNLLREIIPKGNKLIAVYGSAGGRDATKRPAMGKAGGEFADITIFTADDPRDEDVLEIIKSMEEGARIGGATKVESMENSNGHFYIVEPDREKAIKLAVKTAQKGDIVALLGKGHEKSLAVKGQEIPWSDKEKVKEAIKEVIAK